MKINVRRNTFHYSVVSAHQWLLNEKSAGVVQSFIGRKPDFLLLVDAQIIENEFRDNNAYDEKESETDAGAEKKGFVIERC